MQSLSTTIKKTYAGTYPYPYRRPNPSNLASCRRFIWYQVYHPEIMLPLPEELRLLFEEGNRQEAICIELLEKVFEVRRIAPTPASNMKGSAGKYSIYGRPDVLVKVGDKWYVTEIKSVAEYALDRLAHLGVRLSHPYYYDQIQATLLIVSQNDPSVSSEGAYLFARSRDTGDIHDEFIARDEAWLVQAISNLDLRAQDLSNGDEPPARPYVSLQDFHCRTCPARETCWQSSSTGQVDLSDLSELHQALLLDNLHKYMELASEKSRVEGAYDDSRVAIRAVLDYYSAVSIVVEEDNLTYTPQLRASPRVDVNIKQLRSQFPEVANQVIAEKTVKELRVHVERDGKTIRR